MYIIQTYYSNYQDSEKKGTIKDEKILTQHNPAVHESAICVFLTKTITKTVLVRSAYRELRGDKQYHQVDFLPVIDHWLNEWRLT